ncbi:collagen-like protein [Acidipropionibacterium acidipropionici]|uniref:collagen-like protein n=1 Tax=Acidipropionibacterium acidipropionici TaxID=1748 RepID=UPI00110AEE0A|nr:collagen-like protein [Acidipropionibacterium acidipropionici]QCV95684.1 collagen-like protein [Acidipropionibacterium acidipropionici]
MPQTTNLLNTERKQRRRAERLGFWQTIVLIALVVVVGVGGMWSGTVVGQRNHATGEADKNAAVAQSLAARVQAACRLDTDEGRSLRRAGLCAAASSASAQVTAAGKAGAQGMPGPAGPSGASGQPGRDATGKAGAAGSAGASGQPGRDATGKPGVSGAPGAPGADSTVAGPAGPSGPAGADGRDGKDGSAGRGIASLACTDGDLVVTFTDGTNSTVTGATVCQPTTAPTTDPT